jgi:coenzyme F420-dependent glucose-6-phosphate dehydrogenase
MAVIGYHASHEQFKPSELLAWSILAEKAGFKAINCSDHFYPWSERQGQSGFSFAWLGAALQATTLPIGMVCSPGYRYHPAIVAQAIATYGEMFPDRFWISLGSGEALNERITGEKFPPKEQRNERLRECYSIIKRLLLGETVTHYGHTTTEEARLYTRPEKIPLILGAAVTTKTAAWLGSWAEGMITISAPHKSLKKVVEAFRDNGGEGKPIFLKTQLSYAGTLGDAQRGAFDQWRTNIFSGTVLGELWTVEQFDALGDQVQASEVEKMVRISNDIQQHIDWIEEDLTLGFEKIILHNVNREQERFIHEFGSKVLPSFAG